jgi:hypothetical protein
MDNKPHKEGSTVMKRLLLAAALLLPVTAYAQIAGSPPPNAVQGGSASLAVTTTSARIALPSSVSVYPVVLVINTGANDAFVNLGTVAVTAAVTNTPIPAGHALALTIPNVPAAPVTNIAAITSTSTASLYIVQFNGQPFYR